MVPTSATAGMGEEHGVDLGRVDVHAAGDDEVGGAVGEEEEAVVVDAADVAEGEEVAAVGRPGLVVVAEVLEARLAGGLDPHQALLAGGQPLARRRRRRRGGRDRRGRPCPAW